jgi:hypothetical protein
MKPTFEEVTVCPHCEEQTIEKFAGDEGATFCSDECGNLEGETLTVKHECQLCYELNDEPKCECPQHNDPI